MYQFHLYGYGYSIIKSNAGRKRNVETENVGIGNIAGITMRNVKRRAGIKKANVIT